MDSNKQLSSKNIRQYIGDYEKIYVGCSKNNALREEATSGGVVTQSLLTSLENGKIKAAVVVGMDKEEPWKPVVKIAETKDEILAAKGSKYTAIKVNQILDKVYELEERNIPYAVVGLPCHIRIIKKLMKRNEIRFARILIGLFCGFNMNFEATEYILEKLNIDKNDISSLQYRAGPDPGGFLVTKKSGRKKFIPKYYYDFLNLMFLPSRCEKCRGYMSEEADISCGDAWGYKNKTVVIQRNSTGKKLLSNDQISLEEINEKELLSMHGHNLVNKKFEYNNFLKFAIRVLKFFKPVLPFRVLGFLAGLRRKLK